MKVLLVLEATLGGTGRHVLDLAGELLNRGIETSLVYSTRRADRQFLSGLASLRAVHPEFHCYTISITREVTFSDITAYKQLSRYVRVFGPFDLIHAHSTKAGFLARLLLSHRQARIVYTPHALMSLNPELEGFRRVAVCALEATLAHRSDAIVAVSENERLCAIQTGIDPSKLVVIPNGIHFIPPEIQLKNRQAIRDSMKLCPDSVCIGVVGRLAPQKQPEGAIEAFALLKQPAARGVHLALIGIGPLEVSLRRAVIRLGIEDRVHFLGPVDGAAHMPAFDILAHTARFEAFGYVLVEALSAGVPVVTTRVGGSDELISPGVTGYVCDPWNANAFADYLQLLVDDPGRRSAMSLAARKRAAEYTVAKMVDSTAELYSRLCARVNPAWVASPTYETLPTNSE